MTDDNQNDPSNTEPQDETGDPADLLKKGGPRLVRENWDKHPGNGTGNGRGTAFIIQSATEFLAGFRPPDYLVDGIIQRGYLYSLTAKTGHGKTAVSMAIAQAVLRGQPLAQREVTRGSVLYLAGENPDDIRMRTLVMSDVLGFNPRLYPLHFIGGVVSLKEKIVDIALEAGRFGAVSLVIVDTAAAYFAGDDSNNNAQVGEYARLLRQLTRLPGRPAVIVCCHPVKNASQDNLLPVGGGAFVNEVDGNLTLWKDDETLSLHWQGKFRGPEFQPVPFRLETKTSELVKDSKGRLMPTIMARTISDVEYEAGEATVDKDVHRLLEVIGMNANASIAELARAAGWFYSQGSPNTSKVWRIAKELQADRLVEKVARKLRLTDKGKKEVGQSGD